MEIVFVSNFLNHHQIPLCEELRVLAESFWFIATENGTSQGYQVSQSREYVIDYQTEKARALEKILSADAVVFGSCPNELIQTRMRCNKLSFLFSERFFKKGTWRRWIPKTRKAVRDRIVKHADKQMYALCASAFLPYDLSLLRFPSDKCLRWGYFPRGKCYEDVNALLEKKRKNSILWAGRMISLKHPELAVYTAKRLTEEGCDFSMNIIGDGPLKADLQKQIDACGLSQKVHILGSMKPEQVRDYMEQSEIFLFTSDRNEGWGAVLNEAMNSACAVVASSAIGSVPYLVEDGQSGLIFRSERKDDLVDKVKILLTHPEERAKLGESAYRTIAEEWNANIAARRLVEMIDIFLKENKLVAYDRGPCSRAEVLGDNWKNDKERLGAICI